MKLLRNPLHFMALLGWLHLIALALLWDWGTWLWLAIKLAVLLALLPGIMQARNGILQLASMVVLLFMAEGCVRAFGATAPSNLFGWAQFIFAWITFFGLVLYLRPFKQAAKQAKKQTLRNP
jgi:uncharacterized membrane protein